MDMDMHMHMHLNMDRDSATKVYSTIHHLLRFTCSLPIEMFSLDAVYISHAHSHLDTRARGLHTERWNASATGQLAALTMDILQSKHSLRGNSRGPVTAAVRFHTMLQSEFPNSISATVHSTDVHNSPTQQHRTGGVCASSHPQQRSWVVEGHAIQSISAPRNKQTGCRTATHSMRASLSHTAPTP